MAFEDNMTISKPILSATIAAATLFGIGAAFAADLPVKAPVAPAPVYSWAGFYIGAEVGGYGDNQSATTNPFPSPGFGAPSIGGAGLPGFGNLPTSHGLNGSGVLGGVYAGYNWQTATNFLLGVEFDIDGLNRSVSNNQNVLQTFGAPPSPSFNMLFTASNNWLASLRARAGWINGKGMIYITGGPAWTRTGYSATATGIVTAAPVNIPGVAATNSWSTTQTGYAIGVGGEWMLTPNWIVRAEYVHYGFGGSSATLPLVGTFAAAGVACGPGACNWALNASHQNIDTGVIGISYKFGGPVVAKY
jgi:outer membrane immunogenic protein